MKWRVWEKGVFTAWGRIYHFPPRGKIDLKPLFVSTDVMGTEKKNHEIQKIGEKQVHDRTNTDRIGDISRNGVILLVSPQSGSSRFRTATKWRGNKIITHNICWGKKWLEVNFSSRGKVIKFPSSPKNSFFSNPSFHGKTGHFEGKGKLISREDNPSEGKFTPLGGLDGRNRTIVIAESLARVIAEFESLAFVGYHFSPQRNEFSQTLRSLCCAIGVHSFNIRSTWNCGMACESWPHSLNVSDWRLAILPNFSPWRENFAPKDV